MNKEEQYKALCKHVHNWMIWFVEGKGEYDGHNFNRDTPDVDISSETRAGISLSVDMLQNAIKQERKISKYFSELDKRYFDFIIADKPQSPDYRRKNLIRLCMWNIHYWLKNAYNELEEIYDY